MNLLVINPNTSDAMTEDIRKTVERVRAPDTSVTVMIMPYPVLDYAAF